MNFTTLWDKIKAWISGEAQVAKVELTKDEQAVLALVQPLLGSAESAVLQDLVVFATGVLTQAKASKSLADWETAVLNALQTVGGELLTLAESLGSNLLQSLIGLILAKLATA